MTLGIPAAAELPILNRKHLLSGFPPKVHVEGGEVTASKRTQNPAQHSPADVRSEVPQWVGRLAQFSHSATEDVPVMTVDARDRLSKIQLAEHFHFRQSTEQTG